MRLLDKIPEINFEHLLSTIPRNGLFRNRLEKYDPDIIRKCDVKFILDSRETARKKVSEPDPKKRSSTRFCVEGIVNPLYCII